MKGTAAVWATCSALALSAVFPESKSAAAPVEMTIDAGKPGAPINPFIYGQFIEHLGRCIYGGIWAEMLEDRKFFFPINDKYDPYRGLKDTQYPVVGASPWEVVGPAGSVTMWKNEPFVGEQSALVRADSAIRQNDLGLVAGKKYVGHAWLRAAVGTATADITLAWGDGANNKQTITIKPVGTKSTLEEKTISKPGVASVTMKAVRIDFARHDFEFTVGANTDHGQLTIAARDGHCLIGAVSLMPADNVRGMRRDTLELLKRLHAPIYRWPGGNFVSGYDWRDGIGDRDRRPPRQNPAWTGVEHNDVGIDEFLDFCREVDTEPMIAANTGFGDDYSAAQEVEYCNGSADTIGGGWRVTNGRKEPYGVKYWCVGNEMWGPWQLGFMRLDQYSQKHNRTAKAMHKVDPQLILIGSGDLGTRSRGGRRGDGAERGWSQGMLEDCADNMNLLSEHFYVRTPNDDIPKHVAQIVDAIRSKAEGHRKLQADLPNLKGRVVPIAMDEWNYWYPKYEYGELGCVYTLRDALGIAAGLHEYFRNSDLIQMAEYAQTVNVIGCVKTTKTAAFLDTTALPLQLYCREFGKTPLAVTKGEVESSLDVVAAKTEDGKALTVAIVNPEAKPQVVKLAIHGVKTADKAKVWRIAGDDPKAINTVDKQAVAIVEEAGVPFAGELTVPEYSANLYRVAIEGQ